MKVLLATAIAYTIGSVPFGYLIVKAKAGADVRQSGSGGTGATNVSRRAGKGAGLVTLVLDAAKGALAVLLAQELFSPRQPDWTVALAAVAVVLGHIFPVWLGFRGGKGVATGVGVFLVLAPASLFLAGILFLVIFYLTRYVSLASILASLAIPLLVLVRARMDANAALLMASFAIATLIVFAHRANIGRLIRGTENKFR